MRKQTVIVKSKFAIKYKTRLFKDKYKLVAFIQINVDDTH